MRRFALLLAVVGMLLIGVVPAGAAGSIKIEGPATEMNDAREPLMIGCDEELYTAVDGYFVGHIRMGPDGAFGINLRTDVERKVIVEDTAGGHFVLTGTIVGEGVSTAEGDIVDWQRISFRISEEDGGRPVAVFSAYGVGAGGDAVDFTRVNGTCESVQP
jgi:hypothetical protein